jgi:copper chaperone
MSESSNYTVHGMTCGGCATKVSTAVNQVPGVTAADVDLATGTLQVRGVAIDHDAVRAAITDAGYQVS